MSHPPSQPLPPLLPLWFPFFCRDHSILSPPRRAAAYTEGEQLPVPARLQGAPVSWLVQPQSRGPSHIHTPHSGMLTLTHTYSLPLLLTLPVHPPAAGPLGGWLSTLWSSSRFPRGRLDHWVPSASSRPLWAVTGPCDLAPTKLRGAELACPRSLRPPLWHRALPQGRLPVLTPFQLVLAQFPPALRAVHVCSAELRFCASSL